MPDTKRPSAAAPPAPTDNKYGVIIADPPWTYNNFRATLHGAPQYKVMSVDDIAAIPVGKWCRRNTLLLLWATWPKLPDAITVLEAWGFTYVTAWPWIKTVPTSGLVRTGIGFWAQSTSEIMIIARRGKPRANQRRPVKGLLCGSLAQFYHPTRKHSEKPWVVHDYARQFPGPYLELFARRPMPGFTCWGNELGFELGPWGVRGQ